MVKLYPSLIVLTGQNPEEKLSHHFYRRHSGWCCANRSAELIGEIRQTPNTFLGEISTNLKIDSEIGTTR